MKKGRFERREGALSRLQKQLNSGKKLEKVNGKQTSKFIKLDEKDVKRINKEIEILKERIK